MPLFKSRRFRKKIKNPIQPMKSIIAAVQKWSHSKIGWAANKVGVGFSALLLKTGLESGEASKILVASLVAFVAALLEFGVKMASDKLVGGIQSKFPASAQDKWPGPQTRINAGAQPAPRALPVN